MKLNKINRDAYEEILNDLLLFVGLNPNSSERYFDFTPIQQREGYTKYDNPQMYIDMLDYARAMKVLDVTTEQVKIYNPFPDLVQKNAHPAFNVFDGETTQYRVKIDTTKLNQELSDLEDYASGSKEGGVTSSLYLKNNQLCVESEYGKEIIKTLRTGLVLYRFVDYVLNTKPGFAVDIAELNKHGLHTSDTLTEMLRKSGFNETIKHYFVPIRTSDRVCVNASIKVSRSDWNKIIGSLK